ncbi:MAG: transporter substrate-binding domain-containing protein [Elainellaceae cyanobacterium]
MQGWRQGLGIIIGIALLPVTHTGVRAESAASGLAVVAQAPPEPDAAEPLTVGIGGTPPFLLRQGDNYQGIVPDLWERIARINGLEYELVLQTETQAALEAVATGELDLLVGPFTVTAERLEQVNFTRAFFTSGEGVLLPQQPPTLWSRTRPFFTTAALSSVGGLLVCLFLVGNAIWLAEHKRNPDHFSKDYIPGIGHGMWFALVTLTTVGYGDCTPVTAAGRFIASVWMLISLIAVSSLIGGLASAFTLALSETPSDRIVGPDDLRQARIAVVTGSAGATTAAQYGAKLLHRDELEEAIALVSQARADAVVFDRPALAYYLQQNPELDLRLAAFTLNSENFAFALPHGSPLARPLDVAILQLKEDGTVEAIGDRWLGEIVPEQPQ